MSEWISVEDRLPDFNKAVLVFYESPMWKNPTISVALIFREYEEWRQLIGGYQFDNPPTHWMPLPEPPKAP